VLETLPHAVGCSLGVLEPAVPEVEPDPDPAVTTPACALPAVSEDAALAEGGGTVRSLWQ
jgi:hypothetical protein